MKSVFISHSSKDKALAHKIVEIIEKDGISCWLDVRDIPSGSNYGAEIIKGIKGCHVLLLLFSEHSNTSQAVVREVQKAFEENKIIIPLMLSDVEVSDDLGFYISGVHWISGDDLGTYRTLIKDIKNALNTPLVHCDDVEEKKNIEVRKKNYKKNKILKFTAWGFLGIVFGVILFSSLNSRVRNAIYNAITDVVGQTISEQQTITQDTAVGIIMRHINRTLEEVDEISIRGHRVNDDLVWEIRIFMDEEFHDFYVDMATGQITLPSQRITADDAIDVILAYLDLSLEQVNIVDYYIDLHSEFNRLVWEVYVIIDDRFWSYEIDIYTAQILYYYEYTDGF